MKKRLKLVILQQSLLLKIYHLWYAIVDINWIVKSRTQKDFFYFKKLIKNVSELFFLFIKNRHRPQKSIILLIKRFKLFQESQNF